MYLEEKGKIVKVLADRIVSQVEDKIKEKTFSIISVKDIDAARLHSLNILYPDLPTFDHGPQPGDADSVHFNNEQDTGVNVVEEF